jgi:hypothetical protein
MPDVALSVGGNVKINVHGGVHVHVHVDVKVNVTAKYLRMSPG